MEDLVATKEVCRILDVDKSTVSRLVSANKLTPAFKGEGPNGFMLFHRHDINRIKTERETA